MTRLRFSRCTLALLMGGIFLPRVGLYAATAGEVGSDVAKAPPPNVPGIQKPLTINPGSADRGRQIVIARTKGNCLACHKVPAIEDVPFQGTLGPVLEILSNRYNEAQLRQMIADSRVFYPNTVMPSYLVKDEFYRVDKEHLGKTLLAPQDVEDVVAFLKTLR